MNGGSPLAVARRVACADWSPDGKNIAAVRLEGNAARIEFPIGKSLYRTGSLLGCLRVSPDGSLIAFTEHPVQGDDGGDLKILDMNGNVRTLSAGWATLGGVAWPPSGKEVWFTAARTGGTRSLWAVSLTGKLRLVSTVPGSLRLEDISRDGRVLVARQDWHLEMAGRVGNDSNDRDLTWFDWTGAADLSADGNLVLFDESGDGGGANWTVYLHRVSDGSTLAAFGRARSGAGAGWEIRCRLEPHQSEQNYAGADRRRTTSRNLRWHRISMGTFFPGWKATAGGRRRTGSGHAALYPGCERRQSAPPLAGHFHGIHGDLAGWQLDRGRGPGRQN